jgi:hypothetical protein
MSISIHDETKADGAVLDRTLSEQVFIGSGEQHSIMVSLHGQLFNSLLDTGADVSFIDKDLATELGLSIRPPTSGGSVHLAHAGFTVPRTGNANAEVTMFFPQTNRVSVSLSHDFEIMPLFSKTSDYHFTIGKDLLPSLFPDGLPSPYYAKVPVTTRQPASCSATVSSGVVETLESVDDQPDVLSVSTADELEQEYAVERKKLLARLEPLLSINASLSGFCNVPEAVVTLVVDPELGKKLYRKQYTIAQTLMAPTTVIIDRWFATGKICLISTSWLLL